MAGRGRGGRGRGRGAPMPYFVNKELKELLSAHGLAPGRSEEQPPPLYDKSQFTKPVPLVNSEEQDYLVTVRQLFREAAKNLPYYLKVKTKRKDVECYSDKYLFKDSLTLQPDWSRLPEELHPNIRRKRKLHVKKVSSPVKKAAIGQISNQLEELEKNEPTEEEEEPAEEGTVEKKKVEGEEDEEEYTDEDEYDELEQEEENDYAKNYYESDESVDDDDDNLDADRYY